MLDKWKVFSCHFPMASLLFGPEPRSVYAAPQKESRFCEHSHHYACSARINKHKCVMDVCVWQHYTLLINMYYHCLMYFMHTNPDDEQCEYAGKRSSFGLRSGPYALAACDPYANTWRIGSTSFALPSLSLPPCLSPVNKPARIRLSVFAYLGLGFAFRISGHFKIGVSPMCIVISNCVCVCVCE